MQGLTPERWRRAEGIFRAALDCPAEKLDELLDRSCGADRDLRRAVEDLLQEDPGTVGGPELDGQGGPAQAFEVLGKYRLGGCIGEGGMSTVYLGQRIEGDLVQQVAIKLMKGVRDPSSERFLRREIGLLSRLEHPNIARFVDSGTHRDGRPYVVMEYVEGVPITEYCNRCELSLAGRLDLFGKVCEAVGYAHQNLIVHRDIKPGNVLVADGGVPKLLDFGIAKALDPGGLDPTLTGERFLTPGYASPEQIAGEPVTTASDLYSLGVLLFRLLAGQSPFGRERSREMRQPPSMVEALSHADPELARQVAAHRGCRPAALRRRLRGDLETIVGLCLQPKPADRYPSVELLAEDLRRYLQGLPIRARPPSFRYRLSKFLRRHLAASLFAALAVASLLGLAVSLYRQAGSLREERDRARQAQRESEEVSRFLTEIFRWPDPYQGQGVPGGEAGRELVHDLLDFARQRLAEEMSEQPLLQARLQTRLAEVYFNLGYTEVGLDLLRQGLETRRRELEPGAVELVESLSELGSALVGSRKVEEGEPLVRDALAMSRAWGQAHPVLADSLNALGKIGLLSGDFAMAADAFREAWEVRRALEGESREALGHLLYLGQALWLKKDLEEAEAILWQAMDGLRSSLGEQHPDVASAQHYLGWTLFRKGERGAAEEMFRSALALRVAVQGREHPAALTSLAALGEFLQIKGDYEEAESLLRQALDLDRRIKGEKHREVALDLHSLGKVVWHRGRLEEAEGLLVQAVELGKETWGPEHRHTLTFQRTLSWLWRRSGRLDAAGGLLRQTAETQGRVLGEGHRNRGMTLLELAITLVDSGDAQEGYGMALEGSEILRRALPADSWQIAYAGGVLGSALTALGRYAEAEPRLLFSHSVLAKRFGAGSERSREARARLHALYLTWGRTEDAERFAPREPTQGQVGGGD